MIKKLYIGLIALVALGSLQPVKAAPAKDTLAENAGKKTVVIKVPVAVPIRQVVSRAERYAPRPFKMALKTNLLYDALLLPSGGAEVYIGGGFAVAGSWTFGWKRHYSKDMSIAVRAGEVEFRQYFGGYAKRRVLSGHHIGVYGTMFAYDFEKKRYGYMVNNSKSWACGAGLSYGYSMPIGKRLNLDFGIGVGYVKAKYEKYEHIDACHVKVKNDTWKYTGPTRAEVTLVWTLFNPNKQTTE